MMKMASVKVNYLRQWSETFGRGVKITVLLWMLLMMAGAAQGIIPDDPLAGLTLFTDRPWVVSGDTIWFWLPANTRADRHITVATVQLESTGNIPANQVSVRCGDKGGMGYFPVPDSLPSGIYWLRSYTAHLRDLPRVSVPTRVLTVFNRFDEGLPELEVPVPPEAMKLWELSEKITILPEREVAGTRDTIRFSIAVPAGLHDQISDMVISAALDWNTPSLPDRLYLATAAPVKPDPRHPLPPATNGTIIEGHVLPADREELPDKSLVILSIPGTFPVFDYCIAGSDGFFRFILKNASGTATLFLQAIAGNNRKLTVRLADNRMCGIDSCRRSSVPLEQTDIRFIKSQLDAARFSRIFSDRKIRYGQPFVMPYPYQYPFYGKPDQRIVPADFTDLPDFREISRELLPGVKYRMKHDTVSLQVLNLREKAFFEKNPLRLVDGIPVFDNNLLSGFSSNDIRYIDVVSSERIWGDLSFKGVVALYLNDKQRFWYAKLPQLLQFTIPCLQVPRSPGYHSPASPAGNRQEPDFRQVFLFQPATLAETTKPFVFTTSDLKGRIVIKVRGVTTNGQPFETTSKINVK